MLDKKQYDLRMPEILTKEEEQVCMICLNNRYRKEAKETLICHNLRLVPFIADRYKNPRLTREELISDGYLGLVKAAETFSTEYHIRFVTYAAVCIRNEIIQGIRNAARYDAELVSDSDVRLFLEQKESEYQKEDPVFSAVARRLVKSEVANAYRGLEETERLLLEFRYIRIKNGKNYSQEEIAKELGISQSYVSRIEKKALGKIKKQVNCGTIDT